jgi:hypothetical protein
LAAFRAWLRALAIALALLLALPRHAAAQAPPDGGDVCDPLAAGACGATGAEPGTAGAPAAPPVTMPSSRGEVPMLVFYWGIGCPHCEEASPFVRSLEEGGGVVVERVEIRNDPAGRDRFLAEVKRLGISAPGIPMFVVGDRHLLGFRQGLTEARIQAMIRDAAAGKPANLAEDVHRIDLPWIGAIEPGAYSLTALALVVGLVDGINPCAMYVLVAMLSILLHVRSRARLLLFGGTFVVMSGVVYFLFMTAWLNLFALTGFARWITVGLGVVLMGMGLINLKEVLWFKKGVSLMIPDKAKPGLFRRMRSVAGAASLPAALAGIAALAFVVNLVELGCTLGLPAVFTRILSLRADVSSAGRYLYLALYNVAYVVPLAVIVVVVAATLHRITLGERGAKALKVVSGALLVGFGVLFVVAPEMLQ